MPAVTPLYPRYLNVSLGVKRAYNRHPNERTHSGTSSFNGAQLSYVIENEGHTLKVWRLSRLSPWQEMQGYHRVSVRVTCDVGEYVLFAKALM